MYKNKSTKYEIDTLDLQILELLQRDARTPYLDIARKLSVSGGTIHQRMDKLKKMKIVTGSSINIDYNKLGFGVTIFLGINVTYSRDIPFVVECVSKLPEVTELHYTTGDYSLMAKVTCLDITHFNNFLQTKVQNLDQVRSTQSNICLQTPETKHLDLSKFVSNFS